MKHPADSTANVRSRRDWRGAYIAAGLFLLAVTIVLCVLAAQLMQELARLKSTSTDNVQWQMAQTQVELLTLTAAINQASLAAPSPGALKDVRQRFDIFYSRIETLRSGSVFNDVTATPDIRPTLQAIGDTLDETIPVIDGPDDALQAALPQLFETYSNLRQEVRAIALAGVRILAHQSDRDREAFARLLVQTGLVATGVLTAMFIALFLFVWQVRIARLRSDEIQTQNRLYRSAVNASLDAIIVSDETGKILDFNAAAENLFGYKRENVIGIAAEKLIIPPEDRAFHRQRRQQFLEETNSGEIQISGRLEIDAMRANGENFPAEVSVGIARGTAGRLIVTYMRDIAEMKQAQNALTRARDDAVATAKAKSDFLAVMSHEMRTPLNGVMGLLDMLDETRLTRKQRDYVQTAINSGEILQRHIDDVLDITRIEAGVKKPKPTNFPVAPLLTELQKMNDPAAKARGNVIEVEVAEGVDRFEQDRNGLRQVLINLVGNAVKFTENGTILIRAEPIDGGDRLQFSVSDTGIGIDPKDAGRIFDDFVMLDPSYQRTAPGSGLGLGISKRIVDMMGGTISLTSTPGKGSRFVVSLPPLHAPETAQPGERESPPAETTAVTETGLKVLLVEDNETNRFVAREMLSRYGCEVTEAHDGREGVEKAEAACFDVIFMDVSMPTLDGISATRLIRQGNGLSARSPIIGLTAHALPEEQKSLIEAGMNDCIIKPLRKARVAEIIASLDRAQPAGPSEPSGEKSTHDDLIDHDTLKELAETLSPELLRAQIDRFIKELKEIDTRLDDRQEDQSGFDGLAAAAHKLAGSSAVFGAAALRAKLLEIETAARFGDQDRIPQLCTAATDLARRTLHAFEGLTDRP